VEKTLKKWTVALPMIFALVPAMLASNAFAAPAADNSEGALEEIVVTAQKRAQNVQDVPIAITAFNSEQMAQLGITSAKDIQNVVPGVIFDSTSSGGIATNLTVRGISQSDYSANQESPNAIYLDDVYLSSSGAAAFTMYDMDRVEVLRGPQGTLFGRNATGGLASFFTARPTKDFEAYAEVGFGQFNEQFFEGAVSGPISDRVRVRLSGREETNSGWWTNYEPGGHNTFETRFRGFRAQIEADVTDELTALLSLTYDDNPKHREGTYTPVSFYLHNGTPTPLPANVDYYGTGAGNDLTGYRSPYAPGPQGDFNNTGYFENKRLSPTLRLDYKVGSTTFTSITNFTAFSFQYNEDCDGGPLDYCDFPFGQTLNQYSEELRATGVTGPATWNAGLYYLDIDQDVYIDFVFPALSGTSYAFNDFNDLAQRTTSVAPFGQVEWKLSDTLDLTTGVRYTHDRKTFDSQVYYNELGNGYSGGTGTTVYNPPLLTYNFSKYTVGDLAVQNSGLVSGKIELDYKPAESELIYAGVSRGVKGGGFNTNVSGGLTNAATPFKPEHALTYEIGSKVELLGRHLRLNNSVYYYDYKDYQGFAFTGLQGVVGNYNGHFAGSEFEVVASLPDEILISAGASYIATLLHDVPTAYYGVRDEQSAMAPKWTFNAVVRKSVTVGPGKLAVQWDGNYLGDRYASVDNTPATLVRESFVSNARVTYDLERQGLQFAVAVDNLANRARQTFAYDLIADTGSQVDSYAKPRWWHATIRKKF
jgi:iron complex outermembrane receptor protein